MESQTDTKTSEAGEDENFSRMTFTQHLGELRRRILRSGIALLVGFLICYTFHETLFEIIARPLAPLQEVGVLQDADASAEPGDRRPVQWTFLNPLEPVLVALKLSAYGGFLLALPFILYQFCAFIFPGLTSKERRVVSVLLYGCSILAAAGAAVAYFAVFPMVLPYLMEWAPGFVNMQLRMNETVSLLIKGILGFAVAFQFPMAVLILVYMDLLTPATLKKHRRMAYVGMFVAGAALTPPDPFSMCMMALPLLVLYELSIWGSYLVVHRRKASAT